MLVINPATLLFLPGWGNCSINTLQTDSSGVLRRLGVEKAGCRSGREAVMGKCSRHLEILRLLQEGKRSGNRGPAWKC